MTEKKRQQKRSTSGGTKSRSSSSSSKTSAAGRKKAAEADERRIDSRVRDEIVSIILIAVGIFFIIAFQTSAAGAIGMSLSHFFKGLFGFAAYILPYYFIIYGILLFMRKTIHVGIKSAVLLLIIFLMISLINSGRFIDESVINQNFWNMAVYYNNGMALDDGGVFGMMVGKTIVMLTGLPGLYIFAVVVVIICLLLLMNTPVSRFFEKAKEKKARHDESKQERMEAKRREKPQAPHPEDHEPEYESAGFAAAGPAAGYAADNMQGYIPTPDAHSGRVSARQKKILGYMQDDDLASGRNGAEQELDFSLGENREKKKRRKKAAEEAGTDMPAQERNTSVHTAHLAEDVFDTGAAAGGEAETEGFGSPIIVGGFSPKKMEEKLSKAEAAKSMLKEDDFNVTTTSESYRFPPIDLLNKAKRSKGNAAEEENILRAKAMKLEDTLHSFNIDAQVTNVTQGPTVTRYEVHPNSGVKVKGIKNLADDIALNMEAKSIRIEAPIPGKPAVGIEIENDRINMVTAREIIDSAAFKKSESKITFAVGKDIAGKAIVADLKTMPHMLIAGSTGSGKSVCINTIIASFLYKARPDEVKLVLVDPKVVELANYNGIPHLLIPVVTEPSKAAAALNWAVAEMDDRYKKFAAEGVRELTGYNKAMKAKGDDESVMPQIVIIIDELADLMMAAPSQVEESICRLAQKARAAGMHLIVATQRPSVDVITGVIKANIPSRIAFAVSSQVDSRTILDMSGAEKLVGKGDMLFNPLGSGKPIRVQGAFISDDEVNSIIDFVKSQSEEARYSENVLDSIERANVPDAEKGNRDLEDELLPDAIELVVQAQQASVSMLQRRFRIGYNRAARIIDMMEDRQIVGPSDGSRPRQVLITEADLMNMKESTEDIEKE